ncbi:MAG: hypothetical protein IJA78_01595 [Clostridia bacterium]|nr:hypothetical protein [Clostridia bacterium]
MKHKATWMRALLLVLCLVLVLSVLAGCGEDEEIAALKGQLEEIQKKADDNATKIDEISESAESKATVAKLRELVDTIKVTADGAATAAKLEEVITKLEGVKGTADAAATSEALTQAKADLEALIAANATADATVKAALEQADAQIKALAEAATTKNEFNSKIEELQAAIDAKESIANVAAEIEALEKLIAANADADAQAKKQLSDRIDALKAQLDGEVANALSALEDSIKANGTADAATKAALEQAIATAKTELNGKITALESTANELKDLIEANGTADAADKAALQQAIEAAKTELNGKITALESATNELKSTIESAVSAVETELKGMIEANTAADAAFKTEMAEALESLSTALATKANKTEVDNAINALQSTVATLATKTEVTEAINTCKAYADGLKTALEEKITGLTTQFNTLSVNVSANSADIADLKTAVENAEKALAQLKAEDFADNYNKATWTLQGAEGGEPGFSLADFDAKAAEVKKENYADGDYAEFEKAVADLRFFLGRALSVEQIKGYFAELDKIVAEMPTLLESLEKVITEIETNRSVTADAACLDQLNGIYAKITTEIPTELQARYDAIVAAQQNLVDATNAAQAVIDEITAIVTPIVYEDSEAAIVAAEASFATYKTTYFANDVYNALYAEDITAEGLVTNSATLDGYRARYDRLVEAVANKVAVNDKALSFATDSVLWSDLAVLEQNKADVDAWKGTYEIDDANMTKIYGDDYAKLERTIAYAKAMDEIYKNNGVADLKANIEALCGKPLVLYTDTATAEGYRAQLDALKAAIEGVDGYIAADANYETMIGADLLAAFEAVEARVDELAAAKAEVDAIVVQMNAMKGNVAFTDYNTIKDVYDKGLADICTNYSIAKGDANYNEFVANAVALCDELYEEYKELTAKVAEIYVLVDQAMNGTAWGLADGNKILELENYFTDLILMGVEDINLDLVLIVDGVEVPANLKTLSQNWTKCVTAYNQKAQNAQSESVAINGAIESLDSSKLLDVKYYATVKAAWDAFASWAQTHLGIDVNTAAAEDVRAAIEAIQAIHILSDVENCYEFVTTANYDTLVAAYATATENLEAANAEWDALKAEMEALIAEWNIHSVEFATVNARYLAYVNTYYANSIDEVSQLNGEVALYNTFATKKAEYESKLTQAEADAQAIKDAIAALEDATFANAQSVIDAAASIRALIAEYTTEYGCEILTCDLCGVTEAEELALAKAEAKGAYSKAFAEHYTTLTDEGVKAELMTAYERYNYQLDRAVTVQAANTVKNQAISALVDYVDPTPAP